MSGLVPRQILTACQSDPSFHSISHVLFDFAGDGAVLASLKKHLCGWTDVRQMNLQGRA
jgi:hypothetical protein